MMTILWLETRDSHLHSFGELQNYHVWLAYQDGYAPINVTPHPPSWGNSRGKTGFYVPSEPLGWDI